MNISRTYLIAGGAVLALIAAVAGYFMMRAGDGSLITASNAGGACKPVETFAIDGRDVVSGSNDAPLTFIEYASMTCGHCAYFHKNILPQLQEKYIDKGHMRYVFREFPLDNVALAASVLTRCVSKDAYHPFVSMLFSEQATWIQSTDVRVALQEISRRAGLTGEDFDKCLANKADVEAIRQTALKGESMYCINSTPTILLNGRKIDTRVAQDFTKLDPLLLDELKKLGKPLPVAAETKPVDAVPAAATPAEAPGETAGDAANDAAAQPASATSPAPATTAPATPAPATPAPATPAAAAPAPAAAPPASAPQPGPKPQ